jgi:hypothetical protein
MSDVEELVLADVKRIHLNPGDVLMLRIAQLRENDDLMKPFGALEAIQKFLHDTFPHNKCIILDGTSDVEVVGAPDWNEVTREVARRFREYSARA